MATITIPGLNSTETGRILENPSVSDGDFRFTNDGVNFAVVPATVRGRVVDLELIDEQANDPLGYLYFEQTLPANPPDTLETWSSGIEVGPLRRLSGTSGLEFQIAPSTLKAAPLTGQRLILVSSVNGESLPGQESIFITVDGVLKANGIIIETGGVEFQFEAVFLNSFSYYVLDFNSELINDDDESEISLEPGDSLLAMVIFALPDGTQSNRLVAIPVLEDTTAESISNRITSGIGDLNDSDWQEAIFELTGAFVRRLYGDIEDGDQDPLPASLSTEQITAIVERVLANPNVPLVNNAQGQLAASNVSIQTTGSGSAHTPQDVVMALLQRVLAAQELPDGSVGKALQDARKYGPSTVVDTTDASPVTRTFNEQPG